MEIELQMSAQKKRAVEAEDPPIDSLDEMKEREEDSTSTDSSYYYKDNKKRPYWRGRIHRLAFYLTIGLFALFLYAIKEVSKIYLSVYFISQLILYGISSTYHMTQWKSRQMELFFKKLDHSSIFLMISGTQTCVVMSIEKSRAAMSSDSVVSLAHFIPITYLVALLGILKVFFLSNVPKYASILYYIFHGVCPALVVPISWIAEDVPITLLCIAGGAIYIAGSAVYGTRKPDPWPSVFGYHEIFHLMTILANSCFLSTLVYSAAKKGKV